jgi:pyridoxamine 5'-phosphate oxidase
MEMADLRREYTFGGLRRRDLHSDPIQQFNNWFQQALSAGIIEPNAMTLATVDYQGQPSSRVVLLKALDPRGFSFFTNYGSRKGRELEANPRAALTFHWSGLERQVCVRGLCQKVPRAESESYFKSRPMGSRHSAWVSRQSEQVESRAYLERRLEEVKIQYGENVPCPEYWGGYLLDPITVEFWQGRPNRLHDRFLYTKTNEGWTIERLSP